VPGEDRTSRVALKVTVGADAEKAVRQAPRTFTPVVTSAGQAEVDLCVPEGAVRALLVLGHGAGGDVDAPDLVTLAGAAVRAGIAVARVRQPYRVLGRRAPAPARQLDAAWTDVVAALPDRAGPFAATARRLRGRPVVVSGRSSGARVACRTASACGADAVVALAFPLHPPGRPERSRAAELAVDVPLIVVQGSRDSFGRPADFPAGVAVVEVPGADHGLKAPGFNAAAESVVAWVLERVQR
jgi:hypothetical protein